MTIPWNKKTNQKGKDQSKCQAEAQSRGKLGRVKAKKQNPKDVSFITRILNLVIHYIHILIKLLLHQQIQVKISQLANFPLDLSLSFYIYIYMYEKLVLEDDK